MTVVEPNPPLDRTAGMSCVARTEPLRGARARSAARRSVRRRRRTFGVRRQCNTPVGYCLHMALGGAVLRPWLVPHPLRHRPGIPADSWAASALFAIVGPP
jgi:hypothetical protein